MPTVHANVSVDKLKDAFEALDWPLVKSLLDDAGGPLTGAEGLAQALRRSNGLVYEYPAPSKEEKRQALLAELVTYMAVGRPDGPPPSVTQAIQTLHVAEEGYRQLVRALGQTNASKLSPSLHIAAVIERANREVQGLLATLHEQAGRREAITPHIRLQDEEGDSVSPDAGLEAIVNFASMTIQMEAFKGRWLDSEGVITIPVWDEPTEEALQQAGSTFYLATLWRRWRSTEQAARFLGGSLTFVADEDRPADAPVEVTRFVRHVGFPDRELPHRVAAERLHDKLGQNLLEILADPVTQERVARASQQKHLLAPRGLVSNDELHALWSLSEALAYDTFEDQECPGGLRFVEWVRGYCALKELAKRAKASDLLRTRSGWQHYLAHYGLKADTSERLLQALTFRSSSRDLFDHPFVKRQDGKYLLFKAAFTSMNVATVVLSMIGHLGEQLQKKGKGFEARVRKTFESAGLPAYSFKASRDGQEFEYDVVVPWGDYLFVFECKNRSLPNHVPVQMLYFDMENQSNVRQVKRLMKALDDYPDILQENIPSEMARKQRVPVVLNCLPYSIPGGLDGVFFYDYSALARFFKSGKISAYGMKKGEGTKDEVFTGLRIWEGDKPTAEDLIAQLKESVQFQAVSTTLKLVQSDFPLPPDWGVLSSDFQRIEHPALVAARSVAQTEPPTTGVARDTK